MVLLAVFSILGIFICHAFSLLPDTPTAASRLRMGNEPVDVFIFQLGQWLHPARKEDTMLRNVQRGNS